MTYSILGGAEKRGEQWSWNDLVYWMEPARIGSAPQGVKDILSSEDRMFEYASKDPEIAAQFANYTKLRQMYGEQSDIQRQALRQQRAAAARQRSIQRKRLKFQLETGLRDIGQEREAGIEGAAQNAVQRGIYRSGIREENQALVNREADEAQSDLRRDIDLALDMLSAQAAAAQASFAAEDHNLDMQELAANTFLTPQTLQQALMGLGDINMEAMSQPDPEAIQMATTGYGQIGGGGQEPMPEVSAPTYNFSFPGMDFTSLLRNTQDMMGPLATQPQDFSLIDPNVFNQSSPVKPNKSDNTLGQGLGYVGKGSYGR